MATEQPAGTPASKKEKKKPKWRWRKNEFKRKTDELDDAHLIQDSYTWLKLFDQHLGRFSAFDAEFDGTFRDNWKAEIDGFEEFPTDETMLDDEQDKLQTLDEVRQKCFPLLNDVEWFVAKAFPGDERILKEFGFEQARNALRHKHPAQALLMVMMTGIVMHDYDTELAAAGMDLAATDARYDALIDDLVAAFFGYEYQKRLRLRAATGRVRSFNSLWDVHLAIRNLARLVFAADKVVARQFE